MSIVLQWMGAMMGLGMSIPIVKKASAGSSGGGEELPHFTVMFF